MRPDRIREILDTAPIGADEGEIVATSREGRPVRGLVVGRGPRRVSLIAGCHADEPVGPRTLRHLAAHLLQKPLDDTTQWWIVPDCNPDGAARNRAWHGDDDSSYDPVAYLRARVRELPGDDLEFGFPRDADDSEARPEARGIARWWQSAVGPFALHASLHGMAIGLGPWFLIDRAWIDRTRALRARCAERVTEMGYVLHDVERHGEKGFTRIERGFCTRPDSRAMAAHFRGLGDEQTASLFRPSSMEYVRSLGGDCLTLVSEMPLFLGAGKIEDFPVSELRPMPVRDQMELQLTFVAAGLESLSCEEP